jgi:hypothetical protein
MMDQRSERGQLSFIADLNSAVRGQSASSCGTAEPGEQHSFCPDLR